MKNYSVKEVAERFGASKLTVYRWLQAGHFPNAYKLTPGGKTSPYRIPEGDVLAFEEKQRHTSPAT
jgi:excisionase family DNA binding protein